MNTSLNLIENVPTELYIGGRWVESSGPDRIEVRDPATEEVIATVAGASVDDGARAVDAAYEAAGKWAETTPRERSEVLRRAFELLIQRKDEFAALIVREEGKPFSDALGEVDYAAEFFRWYSEEAPRVIGEISRAPRGDHKLLILHQPIGVSVLITPWNFPAAMGTRKIAPALAAGCPVIWKPASETPLTALLLAQLMQEAGVPAGVVNILPSRGSSNVIKTMIDDPRVRKLSFTGSTEVGRILLAQAAEQVVDCSMELGGNAPLVVLDDADLDTAVAQSLIAKMRNTGESCIAANRFYVHDAVADEFSKRLGEAMTALKLGPGLDDGVQVGPLVNEETRDKVDAYVAALADTGAKVITGGRRPNRRGYFYEPTVITDVAPEEDALCTEVFGPVAPIVRFEGDDEVIRLANDTEFGLAAYVFTGDIQRGLHIAERIEAGVMGLNRGFISDPAAAFGGMKQSGVGREGSHEGILEFLETKYIAVDW